MWEVREKVEEGKVRQTYGVVIYEDADRLVVAGEEEEKRWRRWSIILKECIVKRETFSARRSAPTG